MTEAQAIAAARVYAVPEGATTSNAPAIADEESYQSVANDLNDSMDPRIAPNRCIWKVSVQAPWDGLGGPRPGVTAKPAPAFAVLFDVNSGFMFEIAPIYQ